MDFGSLTKDVIWSVITGLTLVALVYVIYWWYLFQNGNKKY
jgi:cbb3-type cytochrome oxidase subunit 3